MGLNDVVSADRLHIGFFGKRNAGKSSVVNAVTGQELSVVSDVLGTTTDPVKKAMELLPLGPVVIIDTPGFDDVGDLGELRVKKTNEVLARTDIAVLVVNAQNGMDDDDDKMLSLIKAKKLPYVIVFNKIDLLEDKPCVDENSICVSAKTNEGIFELKELIAKKSVGAKTERFIVSDLIDAGDLVVLCIPIDESAPKGRLILPQQQTIRDILDKGGIPICARDTELESTLNSLTKKPKMVITDSQAFGKVSKIVPNDIPLTSFSILFARYKGNLVKQVEGASALSKLKDGDIVLISEGCTHHRQCNDIGTVKMPNWIKNFSGADVRFEFTSGGHFPDDLTKYSLIVHCGGCMLNEKEIGHRVAKSAEQNIPMVNYGVAIANMHGILKRSLELFPDVLKLL